MEPALINQVQTRIPTHHGEFTLHYYANNIDNKEHVALVKGNVSGLQNVPVRMHSECFTGDVLGSRRCDCGEQLDMALQLIDEAGFGVLIYLRQEGRGIGLLKKLQAYNLQDQGLDTVDANIHLGHLPDERDYSVAALILNDLNINSIRLLTNNPRKIDELRHLGIEVEERVAIEPDYHHDNLMYLKAKAERMSHLLSFANTRNEHIPDDLGFIWAFINQLREQKSDADKPFITLSYIQDNANKTQLDLAQVLKANHDAVLIHVDTILSEQPTLRVHNTLIDDYQPVLLDPHLSFPEHATILQTSTKRPIVYTSHAALENNRDDKIKRLMQKGVRFISVDNITPEQLDLTAVLSNLTDLNINTLLVNADSQMANRFLDNALVNYVIVSLAAKLTDAIPNQPLKHPRIQHANLNTHELATGVIVYGALTR